MSSRIRVKKNLIIFRNADDWSAIFQQILRDYGSRMAISFVMRRELGFTVRYHQEWIEFDRSEDRIRRYCEEQIHLDFFSESAQSWFQLKYLNLGST